MDICRENLLQEFAVAICRVFFCICKQIFFFVCKQILFIWKETFLYVSKTFLFVRFSLLTVFLFVIAVAVMGHHRMRLLLKGNVRRQFKATLQGDARKGKVSEKSKR